MEDEDRRNPRGRRVRSEIGQVSRTNPSVYDHSCTRNEIEEGHERRSRRRQRDHREHHHTKGSHRSRTNKSEVLEGLDEVRLLERFQGLRPPQFDGRAGPERAEEWLIFIEKMFERMPLSSTKKVSLATYNLVGSAEMWWRNTRDRYAV